MKCLALVFACSLGAIAPQASAQSGSHNVKDTWLSGDRLGRVEIYDCGAYPVSDEQQLTKLCAKARGAPKLCGRVVEVCPPGKTKRDQLKREGKTLLKGGMNYPILCVSQTSDKTWRGGVFDIWESQKIYSLALTPSQDGKMLELSVTFLRVPVKPFQWTKDACD